MTTLHTRTKWKYYSSRNGFDKAVALLKKQGVTFKTVINRNFEKPYQILIWISPKTNPGVKRTTAQYRTLAREAEKKLQWHRAARYWSLAVAAYPSTGALAEADKKNMRNYAHSARTFRGNPSPRRALRRAHIGHRIFIIVRHEGLWTTPQQTPKKSYALATTFDQKKAVAFTDKDSAFDFMKLHFPGRAYRELHSITEVRRNLRA